MAKIDVADVTRKYEEAVDLTETTAYGLRKWIDGHS